MIRARMSPAFACLMFAAAWAGAQSAQPAAKPADRAKEAKPKPKPDPASDFPAAAAPRRETFSDPEFSFPEPPPVWLQTLEALKLEIHEEDFSTWIEPIRFLAWEEGGLTLVVPSVFFRNWIMSNYQDLLIQIFEGFVHRPIRIRYELASYDELSAEQM